MTFTLGDEEIPFQRVCGFNCPSQIGDRSDRGDRKSRGETWEPEWQPWVTSRVGVWVFCHWGYMIPVRTLVSLEWDSLGLETGSWGLRKFLVVSAFEGVL